MIVAQCSTCRFAEKIGYDDHQCRRRAPVSERVDACQDLRQWVPRWPVMKGADWCGDWGNGRIDAPPAGRFNPMDAVPSRFIATRDNPKAAFGIVTHDGPKKAP